MVIHPAISLQPVVAWTKDGKAPDTKKDKDGKAHFEIKEEGGNYCLAIYGVTMDDKGKYQAVFTNRAGEAKTAASLNVLCELISFQYRVTLVGVQPWLGCLRLGEFPRLVGRYCWYLLPKQDGGTFQIKVNRTKVHNNQSHPVEWLLQWIK